MTNPAQNKFSDYSDALSIKEAASFLKVSTKTLRRWEDKGILTPKRTQGGHRRYYLSDLTSFKREKSKVKEETFEKEDIQAPTSSLLPIQEIETFPDELDVKEKPPSFNLLRTFQIASVFQKAILFSSLAILFATLISITVIKLNLLNTGQLKQKAYVVEPYLMRGLEALKKVPIISKTASKLAENARKKAKDEKLLKQSDVLAASISLDTQNFNINVDTFFKELVTAEKDLNVGGNATVSATLGVAGFSTLSGGANIVGTFQLDSTTVTASAAELNYLDGAAVTAGGVTYGTGTGLTTITAGTSGQVLTSAGASAPTWTDQSSIDAGKVDGLDAADFLRSNTSDGYTSGTLTFSDGTFLDLSAIVHNDSGLQGLRLPQNSTFTNLTSGEGFLAWDTDDNDLLVFNGSSWVSVTTTGTNVWTSTSAVIHAQTSTDNVTVGSSNNLAKLAVDGDTDEIQFLVQGNSTQTSNLVVFETSAGTDLLAFANSGNITFSPTAFGSAITFYASDTSFNSSDTGIVDAINTAYDAAIGGSGGVWTLASGVIYPTTTTNNLAIGGTDSTADFFVNDSGQVSFTPATTGTFIDFNLETEWTTGDLINADFASATTQTGALTALDIDFTNLTTLAGSTTYGIRINDLGTQTTATEYGIYLQGGNWDRNLFSEGHIQLTDSSEIYLGTGNDLELYHNGTNSIIDNNTGNLNVISAGSLDIDSSTLDLSTQATDVDIIDNSTTALTISQLTNNYFVLNTDDADTVVTLNLPVAGSSTTTGNLFTSNITKTINIGSGTSADTINIGTGGTTADALTFGNVGVATTFTFNSGADTQTPMTLDFDTLTTGTGIDLSLDGLTTGTGLLIDDGTAAGLSSGTLLQVQSVSTDTTAITDGMLAYFNWNPGSATTKSGDLFRLNIGSSGNITNLFNVTDNGSTLFRVAETQIESAVPHAFTAAGDVTIAYDLVFSNQTASKIESYGPFTLEVGESFENNNLTFKTYGTGRTIFDMGGDVWLQNADPAIVFDVSTATDTDFWMGVIDDAGGDDDDFFRIGDGTTPNTNTFVTIDTSGNVGIGDTTPAALLTVGSGDRFQVNSSGRTTVTPGTTGTFLDFVLATEWTRGDLINADFASATTQTDTLKGIDIDFTNLTTLAGSTTYGIRINDVGTQTTSTEYGLYVQGNNWDIGIQTEGGIALGSQRTLTADSTTPSVSGGSHYVTANTVGTAYTNFTNGTSGQLLFIEINDANSTFECDGTPATSLSCGNTDITAADGDVIYFIYNGTVWNLIEYLDLTTNSQAGGADLAEWYPAPTENTPIAGEVVSIGNSIGNEYIAFIVEKSSQAYDQKAIGVVSANAHTIIGEDVLEWAEVAVPVALAGRVPVKIDPNSPAIEPGDLITSSTNGYATKAVSQGYTIGSALETWSPDSGKEKLMIFIKNSVYLENLPKLADTSGTEIENESLQVIEPDQNDAEQTENAPSVTLESIEALLTQVQEDQKLMKEAVNWDTQTSNTLLSEAVLENLFVTGQAALNSLSITESVVIGGDLVISSPSGPDALRAGGQQPTTSFNTLNSPLEIQSAGAQPLYLMAGLVKIDTKGNVEIAGDLAISGELTAKTVTTEKLVLGGSQETNTSAGSGVLAKGETSLKINAPISQNSLIYITPTSSSLNKVIYVKAKVVCEQDSDNSEPTTDYRLPTTDSCSPGFIVGIDGLLPVDVEFNWWVVELVAEGD